MRTAVLCLCSGARLGERRLGSRATVGMRLWCECPISARDGGGSWSEFLTDRTKERSGGDASTLACDYSGSGRPRSSQGRGRLAPAVTTPASWHEATRRPQHPRRAATGVIADFWRSGSDTAAGLRCSGGCRQMDASKLLKSDEQKLRTRRGFVDEVVRTSRERVAAGHAQPQPREAGGPWDELVQAH